MYCHAALKNKISVKLICFYSDPTAARKKPSVLYGFIILQISAQQLMSITDLHNQ